MDNGLLKQLLSGDEISDVWNHITGNAVTVVYHFQGKKRRCLVRVERASDRSDFCATTPLYGVGGENIFWAAKARVAEEAVALAWAKAREVLTLQEVSPVFKVNPNFPNGPHDLVYPDVTGESRLHSSVHPVQNGRRNI